MRISPTLSIIIATYNMSRFIAETLESVLRQTRTDYEIIVIDDGSTDATATVLQPYRKYIRYRYQENEGVSYARNVGLRMAMADWVLFLDADDTLAPTKLEHQLALTNPDDESLAMIHSGWWLMDEIGNVLDCVTPYEKHPDLDLMNWLLWKPVFPGAMIFRKQWVEKVGGFDIQMTHAEDVDLVLRIALAGGKTVWLKEPTVYYRQREDSAKTNSLKQVENSTYMLDKFYQQALPAKIKQQEPFHRYYSLEWWCFKLVKDGYLQEARSYLERMQAYVPMPMTYHLFRWESAVRRFDVQKQITDETIVSAFLPADEMITLFDQSQISPMAIISRQHHTEQSQLSPTAIIELMHYEIFANAESLQQSDLRAMTAHLDRLAMLTVWLTWGLWAYRQKQMRTVIRSIPIIMYYSLGLHSIQVYVFIYKSIRQYTSIARRDS